MLWPMPKCSNGGLVTSTSAMGSHLTVADGDVCAVGKANTSWPTPRTIPVSSCSETAWATSNRRLMVHTILSARSLTSSSEPLSTLLCSEIQAFATLQLCDTPTVIPLGKRIIRWRVDKGGNLRATRQGLLSRNINHSGICCHQHAAVDRCIPSRREDVLRNGSLHARLQWTPFFSLGRAHDDDVLSVQSHPAFGDQNGSTIHDALRQRSEPFAYQNHWREGVCPYQGRQQARSHLVRRNMVCGFRENESNSVRIRNPKTSRVVESRNVVFIETLPHLLPPSRRLSLLQGLEAPTLDFSLNSLDDKCTSRKNILQDVQVYTGCFRIRR